MKPGADVDKQIDRVGADLAAALGEGAVCIAVYGSAAGEEFSPGLSDVNLLIVLREVTFADLRLIGATLRRAVGQGLLFATPLVIAPSFLRDARDSYPIELADIAARHRILAGEDILANVRIAPDRLRAEAEREARTLLLRLRALVMHHAQGDEIRRILSGLVSTVAIIERALLRAANTSASTTLGAALFAEVERVQGVHLTALARVLEMREKKTPWPDGPALDDLLASVLREVEALVGAIDAQGH